MLSLYSIFLHFCFCKRSCNVQNKDYCILCSKVPTQSADNKVFLKIFLLIGMTLVKNFCFLEAIQ